VDFGRGNDERLAALDVAGELLGAGPIGEILDPPARVDEDQSRSSFSRSPASRVPFAKPR
jgi:hypothetical protein